MSVQRMLSTLFVVTLFLFSLMVPSSVSGAGGTKVIDEFEEGTTSLELFVDDMGAEIDITLPVDAEVKDASMMLEGMLPPIIDNLEVGDGPMAITGADVDGDGDLDLAVVSSKEDSVSVLLNDGEGDFGRTKPVDFTVGSSPYDLVLDDFDQDGALDLATADYASGTVTVRSSTMDLFSATATYTVGGSPLYIASHDLDGDEAPDIVVVRKEFPILTVLFNKGDGSFNPYTDIDVQGSPEGFALADFDGDKDLDIAVASTDKPYSIIMVDNEGGRSFKEGDPVNVQWPPSSVVASDLTGNGFPDLAVPSVEGDITVIRNLGPGFSSDRTVLPYTKQKGMFAIDLNSDGINDLVSMARVYNTVQTFITKDLFEFELDQLFMMGNNPNDLFMADFDADGDPDLATVDLGGDSISVAFNNGRGRYVWYDVYDTIESDKIVGLGDLDGDGDQDAVLSNYNQQSITLAFNDGKGTFKRVTKYEGYKVYIGGVGGSEPFYTVSADWDGDGDIDVEYGEELSYSIIMMFNKGDGTFTQESVALVNDTNLMVAPPYVTLPVDIDGDKDMDLVSNHLNHNFITILLNDGTGHFKSKINHSIGDGHPYDIVAEDWDGDGDQDFVTANFGMNLDFETTLTFIRNEGGGTFTNAWNLTVKKGPRSLRFADFDMDGKRDLAVAFGASKGLSDKVPGEVGVLLGKGGGQFKSPVYYRTGILPGRVHPTDVNDDGVPDIICLNIGAGQGGSVSVLTNKGDGTFNPQLEYPNVPFNHVSFHDFLGDGQDELILPILSTHIAIYRTFYYPGDVRMTVGAGDTEVWAQDGIFRTTADEGPVNLTSILNDRLKTIRGQSEEPEEGNVTMTLRISAGKAGIVRLSDISIKYKSKKAEEEERTGTLDFNDPGTIALFIMLVVLIIISVMVGTPWTPEEADDMLGGSRKKRGARRRGRDRSGQRGKKRKRRKKGRKTPKRTTEEKTEEAEARRKKRTEVKVEVRGRKRKDKAKSDLKKMEKATRLMRKLEKEQGK